MDFIYPASVNNRKREAKSDGLSDKQLFVFAEKARNVSTPGSRNAQARSYNVLALRRVQLVVMDHGLECDVWLPIVGPVDVLDNVQRLKALMDGCLLRVFEGIENRRRNQKLYPSLRVPVGLLRTPQGEPD